jgi:hypothetical protein
MMFRSDHPMTQTLFNLTQAKTSKEAGQALVESHSPDFVEQMWSEAKRIATAQGSVNSDDLRIYAIKTGLRPHHPNAWGAIFLGKEWKSIGFTRSSLVSNHARTIRVWAISK